MPRIPDEIIDQIVHHFEDDRAMLKTCSVVSPSFCHLAWTRLHSCVVIDQKNVNIAADRITERVGGYVKELYLESTFENYGWLSEGALVLVLRQLTRLQKLRLRSCDWATLSLEFREELHHVFQLPSLSHVQIFAVRGLPVSLFNSIPGLQRLELASVTLALGAKARSVDVETARTLKNLNSLVLSVLPGELYTESIAEQEQALIHVVDVLRSPTTKPRLNNLRRLVLDIRLSGQVKQTLWNLLQACSSSLECLKFHAEIPTRGGVVSKQTEYLDLGCLVTLKTLLVAVLSWQDSVCLWLSYMLGTIAASTRVQEITLAFMLDAVPSIRDERWASLDRACMGANLSALEKVHVRCLVLPSSSLFVYDYLAGFPATVREKMPQSFKRGILDVQDEMLESPFEIFTEMD